MKLTEEETNNYFTFFKNVDTDIVHCGDLSFLFCSILIRGKITLPYRIITGFFEDNTVHTICYAQGNTIDPINNLYIPNFKFTYEKYAKQNIQPIFKQMSYNQKWVNFYKQSYNEKTLLRRNVFVLKDETKKELG